MSKEDSSGLLSKVAKFVRNPGMQWQEAKDSVQPADAYSKQELKEIIERRRRNDFVRRREFDMLRKVRAEGGVAGIDVANRPSFFETSTVSKLDDRDSTLKKIDDIEAQMSQQWWEGKPGARPGSAAAPSGRTLIPDLLGPSGVAAAPPLSRAFDPTAPSGLNPLAKAAPAQASAPTEPMPLRAAHPSALAPTEPMPLSPGGRGPLAPTEPMPLRSFANAPTEPMPLRARAEAPVSQKGDLLASGMMSFGAPAPAPAAEPATAPMPAPAAAQVFQAANLLQPKDQDFVYDPELEEAAIRFASGDDDSVEAVLLASLAPGGRKGQDDETWMTLFDLYRATGNHDKFEAAAMDYAGRFEKSAPIWYSLPQMVGKMGSQPGAATARTHPDWSSPAILGIQSLAALNAALDRLPQPWKLNWSKLNRIEEGALAPFEKLLNSWCTRPVQVRFMALDRLMEIVKARTPNGDKTVNQAWWRLHMLLLRVMHRPDEFEIVALDFCINYEVSPPSWEKALCNFKSLDAEGGTMMAHTVVGDSFHEAVAATRPPGDAADSAQSTQFSQISVVELAGYIVGDPAQALADIEAKLEGADVMVISCAKLIRVDFTAAGALLNWAAARQAEGRLVQFSSLHRMVAAFFHVIGINEHARIVVRNS